MMMTMTAKTNRAMRISLEGASEPRQASRRDVETVSRRLLSSSGTTSDACLSLPISKPLFLELPRSPRSGLR